MAYNARKVVTNGFPFDAFSFTYNLAAGTTEAHVGRALTLDPTGEAQFKPAGDDDAIHGRLFQFEDRTGQNLGLVGTVARKFKERLPVLVGAAGDDVPALGDTVVGAGDGYVKALHDGAGSKLPDPQLNTVIEVGTDSRGVDYVVVEYL